MEILKAKENTKYISVELPIHEALQKHLNQKSFSKLKPKSVKPYPTSTILSIHQTITSTMGNGLYFLNCHNDQGVERSAIAFYADLGDNNLNLNEQPKAFVYTDLVGDTAWESTQKQRT